MTTEQLIQLSQFSENIRGLRTNIEFVQLSAQKLDSFDYLDALSSTFDDLMDARVSLEMLHKKIEDYLATQTREGTS